MINRILIASFVVGSFCLMMAENNVRANDYVWGRSQWTVGPNRPVSAMGNGYGGYYVPRHAYGNNYAGQRITNPTGYIVPASGGQQYQGNQWGRRR